MSKKLYIETYGCQMNVADSEVVAAILKDSGFSICSDLTDADLVLVNTCSVRENAETRVRGRLNVFRLAKKKKPGMLIGVIGCMAERLKEKLLEEEKMVDIVVGPDAYRDLPGLVATAGSGQKAINVLLSREETYADISPVRYSSNGVSAFISIMRGCDKMCAYCVVPFTRGRERSRNPASILSEIAQLKADSFKEVTLLGQNVDSYHWDNTDAQGMVNFAALLQQVAITFPDLRIRFSTSFPKDMTDDVLHVMAKYPNICKNIHLPVQSGSTRILELMRRGYTRPMYLERIAAIRRIIPECALSTDILSGFCSETEQDHRETLSLMEAVNFDFAFMFKYSERPNTYAQRKLADDVPEDEKVKRLTEIINLQHKLSAANKKKSIGKVFEVLVEGYSKRNKDHLFGRNSQNEVVVFPAENYSLGDYVNVRIIKCTSATLTGEIFRE